MWLLVLLIIVLDQFSKLWAFTYLKNNNPIIIVKNFLALTYVENRGAAFGILQDKKIFFIIITIFVVGFILLYFYKNYKLMSIYEKLSLTMILGGAIGNFIDRILRSYVIDFISFQFGSYYFPVFNIADIFIVIGTALLIFLIFIEEYIWEVK